MKVSISVELIGCIGKMKKISTAIKSISNIELISIDHSVPKNTMVYNINIKNDDEVTDVRTSINEIIKKYQLKNSTFIVHN